MTEADLERAAEGGRVKTDAARAALIAAAVVLVNRLLTFVVAYRASFSPHLATVPLRWRFPERAEAFHGYFGHLLNPWAHWDGVWFLRIATNGYSDPHSPAFFPLYPVAVRGVGWLLGGGFELGGIVLSLVLFAGCCALLFALVNADLGPRVALLSVAYLALFPTSFFFLAVYSEGLFLLLTLACFFLARNGRWWLAGLAGFLAALTRSAGVLLVVPMLAYYFEQRDWRLARTDVRIVAVLLIPAGLATWMAYLWHRTGDPLAFSHVQRDWGRAFAAAPLVSWQGVLEAARGARELLWPPSQSAHPVLSAYFPPTANVLGLPFLVFALGTLAAGIRRLPVAYTGYAVVSLLFYLSFPIRVAPLLSLPRFLVVVFPLFVALAAATERRRRLQAVIIVVLVLGLVLLTARFAAFEWVA
jgi:hypothetical protein